MAKNEKTQDKDDADDLPVDHGNVIENTELRVGDKVVEKKDDLRDGERKNEMPHECPVKSPIMSASSPTAFMRQMMTHHDKHEKVHGHPCPDCLRVIAQREEMMPGLIEAAQKSYRF